MTEGGFDPVRAMLEAHRDATRARKRITHWRVNRAALDHIIACDILMRYYSSKPILEREFLGIPLQLDREDCGDEPGLEPVFETYGRSTLIHDYEGPIFHGNDKARLLAARKARLTPADETKLVDGEGE